METKTKNLGALKPHGFLVQEVTPDQWRMGANSKISGPVLMPGGHGWKAYLPPDELQNRNGLETMNCSNYGTLNCWETLAFRVLGLRFNWSERYTGVGTGTTENGNYPHNVAEIIRNEIGLIDEELLPFSNDINEWNEYYSPNPMSAQLLAKGKAFLKKYQLGHDWVFVGGTLKEKQAKLMEALQYSPIGISVLAWKERKGKMWKKIGEGDNHWVELYDFEEGVCWYVFDHYDNTHKVLEWDYDFGYAKRYSITAIAFVPEVEKDWLARFLKAIGEFFKNIWNGARQVGRGVALA